MASYSRGTTLFTQSVQTDYKSKLKTFPSLATTIHSGAIVADQQRVTVSHCCHKVVKYDAFKNIFMKF